MNLPKDVDNWTEQHLERVDVALQRYFDLFERCVGVNEKKADLYYREYQRLCDLRQTLLNVLR